MRVWSVMNRVVYGVCGAVLLLNFCPKRKVTEQFSKVY